MSELKIRIKIGKHEFEAEGPQEIVQAELALFRKTIGLGHLGGVPEKRNLVAHLQSIIRIDDKIGWRKRGRG